MDDNGSLNMRNWRFYEPTTAPKGHLGLRLMSTIAGRPLLGGRDNYHPAVMGAMHAGAFHHHRVCSVSDSLVPMDYIRDAWIRERNLNVLPGNHHHSNFVVLPETSAAHSEQMLQPPNNETVPHIEETSDERAIGGPAKKRPGGKGQKSPKTKKPKRAPHAPRVGCSPLVQRTRTPKRSAEVVINGIDFNISGIPIPVCSCTGTSQQCYRWGSGGWQSACCTTGMSMYPLPMSTKRRGARIAGRKMSLGAFKKVLEKLSSEGYNFSNPIDLRTHWAKHGTNKFVTIK